MERFSMSAPTPEDDPRIKALAMAIRAQTIVRIRFASSSEMTIHPIAMTTDAESWSVKDQLTKTWIERAEWGRINVSARRFS